MKLRLPGAVLAACVLLSATAAHADYQAKGNNVLLTFKSWISSLIHHPGYVTEGLSAGVPTAVNMTASGALDVTPLSLPPGAATAAKQPAIGTAGTPSADVLTVQGSTSGTALKVDGSAVTQPVSAGSLPLPAGASTSANQSTANGSLATIATNSGTQATATNQASVIGTKAAGTAAASSLLTGGVFNTSLPTLTTGQQAATQLDSSGRQIVVCASGCSGGTQFAEDSAHASGDLGTFSLVVRSDAAASTAGTTGDYTAMITDATGHLWTHGVAVASDFADGWDVTQGNKVDPAWTSGSGSVISLLKAQATAALDTTTLSPIKIDQTSTNNNVVVGSSALPTGAATAANQTAITGSKAAGTAAASSSLGGCVYNTSLPGPTTGQQVGIQCDSTGRQFVVAPTSDTKLDTLHTDMGTSIPAGTALIGKVGLDQTTPGSTNGVTPIPATTGGLSFCRVVTGTSGFCKASAGQVYTISYQNTNAGVRYLQLYNKASAPTLSTDTPILTVPLALSSVSNLTLTDLGGAFSTGIAWAVTTDDIAIPTTAGTSGDLHMTLSYK